MSKPKKPAHSSIGASSMYRWSACPGSVRLCKDIVSPASENAAEGTVAHGLAELALRNKIPLKDWLGKTRTADGFSFVVTQEMIDAVQVYLDWVDEHYDKDAGDLLYVEHKFDLSHIHDGLYGTSDCAIWKPYINTLIVADYKHGAGIPVEVKGNPQLRYYGLGALIDLELPAKVVDLFVIQPRCPHADGSIRNERIDAIDLLDFSTDLIRYAVATEDPSATLNPGDHCRFCPAAGTCPELHSKALAVAQDVFAPMAYDPEKLSKALTWLPVLEGWIKSVREFAYTEAEAGRPIPGWKLVAKVARRKWRDEEETIRRLCLETPLEKMDLCDLKLHTPAQIEKLLDKKLRPILDELTVKESSGHTLAPEDDKRPAVKSDAASAFANV